MVFFRLNGKRAVEFARQSDAKFTAEFHRRQGFGDWLALLLHIPKAIAYSLANAFQGALLALVEPAETGKLNTSSNELTVFLGSGNTIGVVINAGHQAISKIRRAKSQKQPARSKKQQAISHQQQATGQ